MRVGRRRRLAGIVASAKPAQPQVANYVDLNGTDEYLKSNSAAVGFTGTFSVFHVCEITDFTDSNQSMLEIGTAANLFRFYLDGTGLLEIQFFDSTGAGLVKRFTAAMSGLATEGVGFSFGVSMNGDGDDAMLVYVDGVDVTSSFTKLNDAADANTDTSRNVTIGARALGDRNLAGKWQRTAVFSTVLSAANFATLHAQSNDSDPLAGFTPIHYWEPKDADDIGHDYGSAGDHDLMDLASNISADDVFAGNLIEL